MNPEVEYLFVYGTLRSAYGGRMHEVLVEAARLVGEGWIAGDLYDTGRYPAAVPASAAEHRIYGELYAVEPGECAELLAFLDRYEGYRPDAPERSLFRRALVDVTLASGETRAAWVYVFARPPAGFRRIVSGDWLRPDGGDR